MGAKDIHKPLRISGQIPRMSWPRHGPVAGPSSQIGNPSYNGSPGMKMYENGLMTIPQYWHTITQKNKNKNNNMFVGQLMVNIYVG